MPSLPRTRPNLIIAGTLLTLLAIAVGYTLYNAHADRNLQLRLLQESALSISAQLDHEVQVSRALLAGLASSPLLSEGDIAGFHRQMLATQRPEGVALVLSDRRQQLANVLRPYGAPLPKLSEFTPQPGFFERLESKGFHVSSQVRSPLNAASGAVVSVNVPGPDGHLKYILSIALGEHRLTEMLHEDVVPDIAGYLVIDAMGQQIALRETNQARVLTGTLAHEVTLNPADMSARSGLFSSVDNNGNPVWTAYARSALTGWTTAVSLPKNSIERMLRAAVPSLILGGFLVGLAIAALSLYWGRRVEIPFQSLTDSLGATRARLTQLNEELGTVRKQEHQRIAQELHDTTAQRLVAADLHLSALRAAGPRDMKELAKIISDVQAMIEQSLKELRSFAFLLSPQEVSEQPFDLVLTRLGQTFADRAGIASHITVDPASALLPTAGKEAFYRITQEALLNIHRHANAQNIAIDLTRTDCDWVLQINDDGVGGVNFPTMKDGNGLGLGIPGMSNMVSKLGGHLQISETPEGTTLRATLPIRSVLT